MALCQGKYHAQVPVTVITVTLAYCHQCQAWAIYAGRITQHDDEDVQADEYVEEFLGPFDDAASAVNLACGHLEGLVLVSGLPWDRSSW